MLSINSVITEQNSNYFNLIWEMHYIYDGEGNRKHGGCKKRFPCYQSSSLYNHLITH